MPRTLRRLRPRVITGLDHNEEPKEPTKIPIVSLIPSPMDDLVLDAALRVYEYARLQEYVQAFAKGKLGLLIVVGPPGTGKSVAMRNATGKDVCWIDNHATAWGLYCQLWLYKDLPVVIDDVDEIYKDKKCVSLMKSLCQTDHSKHLTWASRNSEIRNGDFPDRFDTTSKVCLIANDWRQANINVKALESRGKVIVFCPSNQAIHEYVKTWFDDQEIYEWIGKNITGLSNLDVRHYTQALEDRRAGIDWKRDLLEKWKPDPKRLAIFQLFDPEGEFYGLRQEDKVAKWKEMIGKGNDSRTGSKAGMYRWRKAFGYR